MMEQLDFLSAIPDEPWVFSILQPALNDIVIRNNVSLDKLSLKEGKTYSSVWYDKQMAFRICCRNERCYFGVSNEYIHCATPEITTQITNKAKSEGFTNYSYELTETSILQFSQFLCQVLDQAIDSVQKEFDCCSRFEECSNAKKCTHPNPDFATVCGYRKILKNGQIFYGQNRNTN